MQRASVNGTTLLCVASTELTQLKSERFEKKSFDRLIYQILIKKAKKIFGEIPAPARNPEPGPLDPRNQDQSNPVSQFRGGKEKLICGLPT
jgi:hypothetical protein